MSKPDVKETTQTEDFNTTCKEQFQILNSITEQLECLRDNTYSVGLDKLANKIDILADLLADSTVKLKNAIYQDINRQYKQAVQSSVNVLASALAGIKVQKEVSK